MDWGFSSSSQTVKRRKFQNPTALIPARARHNVGWWQSWGGCPGRWAWAWRWAHGAVCARTCWSAAAPAPACPDSAWWGSWKVASPARTGPPQTVAADSPRGPGSSCEVNFEHQVHGQHKQFTRQRNSQHTRQEVNSEVLAQTMWLSPCCRPQVELWGCRLRRRDRGNRRSRTPPDSSRIAGWRRAGKNERERVEMHSNERN